MVSTSLLKGRGIFRKQNNITPKSIKSEAYLGTLLGRLTKHKLPLNTQLRASWLVNSMAASLSCHDALACSEATPCNRASSLFTSHTASIKQCNTLFLDKLPSRECIEDLAKGQPKNRRDLMNLLLLWE